MGYLIDENDTTKLLLSAVNVLLQVINELPVETTDDLANSDLAKLAEMTINEVKKEVLSQGWDFNSDKRYPFPPDVEGFINISPNVLDIVASDGKNYIMRDWKLYDKDNFSFNFTEAVPCDVIWNMDFNTLTHPIRHYITVKAARVFQARTIGDQLGYTYTSQDVEDAYLAARFSESRTGDYNMLESEAFGVISGGLR